MITQEDILKVVEYLSQQSKKESQFDSRSQIDDNDVFTFLDAKGNTYTNCKIKVSDLKKYIGSGDYENFSIYIDPETYHWIINGVDTGVIAKGEKGEPGVQGEQGEQGLSGTNGINGDVYLKKFTKTNSVDEIPYFNSASYNPGSAWSSALPSYTAGQAVWEIVARVNSGKLIENWSGPVLLTGIPGLDGGSASTPDWNLSLFAQSNIKPSAPTDTKPESYTEDSYWKPYPTNSTGSWWQCVCIVDGPRNYIKQFGEVVPLTGQDGKYTEFRFAKSKLYLTPPDFYPEYRNPNAYGKNDWTTQMPEIEGDYKYIWMIQAVINSDDSLAQEWSYPVCITVPGPIGDSGPAGEGVDGLDGIPGVNMEFRFMIGTKYAPKNSWTTTMPTMRTPTGWDLNTPIPTEEFPYIWFIQARIVFENNDDTIGSLGTGKWSTPARLSGLNGEKGDTGRTGQIIYPAGIYSTDVLYTLDDYKAPYVYDPNDKNYYVLNVNSWRGSSQKDGNKLPSEHVSNGGDSWVKFEKFDAVYAKVGIIANGLIGSAVFNGDYMFSQIGVRLNRQGVKSTSPLYEEFIAETADRVFIGDIPREKFIPNILFDLKKGRAWFGAGETLMYEDGSIATGYFASKYDIVHDSDYVNTGNIPSIKSLNTLYLQTTCKITDETRYHISLDINDKCINQKGVWYHGVICLEGHSGCSVMLYINPNKYSCAYDPFNAADYCYALTGIEPFEYLFKWTGGTSDNMTGDLILLNPHYRSEIIGDSHLKPTAERILNLENTIISLENTIISLENNLVSHDSALSDLESRVQSLENNQDK
jgi:hypothetical protein